MPYRRPPTVLTSAATILLCIADNPDVTVRELAQHVGLTERNVTLVIGQLGAAGLLEREKRGRRNHYRLIRSGRFFDSELLNVDLGTFLDALATCQEKACTEETF